IEAATQSSTTAQSATSTLQPVPSAAVNSTVDTVGKAAINEDENKDEAPSTSNSASGEEAKVDEAIAAPAPVTEQKEVESENELEAEKETDRSVELSTALDGVSTDDATSVVSASVGEDSSNNNWLVIVA